MKLNKHFMPMSQMLTDLQLYFNHYDIQRNDIQAFNKTTFKNDIRQNDIQHNITKNNDNQHIGLNRGTQINLYSAQWM
jgi:hypothetical protein